MRLAPLLKEDLNPRISQGYSGELVASTRVWTVTLSNADLVAPNILSTTWLVTQCTRSWTHNPRSSDVLPLRLPSQINTQNLHKWSVRQLKHSDMKEKIQPNSWSQPENSKGPTKLVKNDSGKQSTRLTFIRRDPWVSMSFPRLGLKSGTSSLRSRHSRVRQT